MPYASYPLHFSDDMLPAAVDGWFDAMAGLYRTAPCHGGSDSLFPLFVTMGSQGIIDAVLHPLAQNSGRRGFALFAGPDDYEAWLALEATDGVPADSPSFARLELTFGSLAEAHPAVQSELERHERTLGDAVPSVWSFDDTGGSRPGNVDDLTICEAIAAAVARTPETASEGVESLVAGPVSEPVIRVVDAGGGDLEVELSASPLGAQTVPGTGRRSLIGPFRRSVAPLPHSTPTGLTRSSSTLCLARSARTLTTPARSSNACEPSIAGSSVSTHCHRRRHVLRG